MATDVNPIPADAEQYADKLEEAEATLREEEQRKLQDSERRRRVAEAKRVLDSHRKALINSDPQLSQAEKVIKLHAGLAAGAAAVLPTVLDLTGIAAIQLRMVSELSKIFGVPFSEDAGKAAIGALTSTFSTTVGATPLAGLAAALPLVKSVAGFVGFSGGAYAATYAMGKVFQNHYASGQTLLSFDPLKAKEAFGKAGTAPVTA